MSDQTIIKIEINGKFYPISCKIGEEDRVKQSGKLLSEIILSLGGNEKKVSESKILLMAALILADKNIRNTNEVKEDFDKSSLGLDDVISWLEKINIKFKNIARLIDNR